MTYFADSDSDSPVPKPSDQMAPTVTLPDAADVASTENGSADIAPASPYSSSSPAAATYPSYPSYPAASTQTASSSVAAQQGMYDPNGYTAGNVPLSSSAGNASTYPPQATAGMGYQPSTPDYSAMGSYQSPTSSGYSPTQGSGYNPTQPNAQYSLGGGSYDIQASQAQAATASPVYADSAQSYANNAGTYGSSGTYSSRTPGGSTATSPYQVPAMPSQGSGYDAGLVQEPYPSQATPAYPGTGASSSNSYSANPSGYSAESAAAGSVAPMPTLPALPSGYTNTQPAYDPGNTGYQPQGVPEYQVPATGGYVQQATATETEFAPGSVSRYPSASTQNNTSSGSAQLGSYGTAGALY